MRTAKGKTVSGMREYNRAACHARHIYFYPFEISREMEYATRTRAEGNGCFCLTGISLSHILKDAGKTRMDRWRGSRPAQRAQTIGAEDSMVKADRIRHVEMPARNVMEKGIHCISHDKG
jgi:hypothetical protein